MTRFLRITGAVLCLAAAVFFLLPLTIGTVHIGMIYPAAFFLLGAAALLFPAALRRLFSGRCRKWAVGIAAVLGAAIVCVTLTLGVIAFAATDAPAEGEDVTVLVLGCQVAGDRPGLMLQNRIETAYDFLIAHPDAVCIATGGKGSGEDITEAECIYRELVAMGIEENRIYKEDRSTSTAENMLFSARIIAKEGLSTTVAVVSDNFHQMRAALFARRAELDPRAVGCRSHPLLAAGYWTREVMALYAAFIRGY